MSLDTNDEILQDFLVEADEIMEGLNEQLVELETKPEDNDLLNAIFRGFHTIKGGAGFLNLENMVAICHQGEDVFNVLRQGERRVDAGMMDTFLQVLDILNNMFEQTRSGEYPSPADKTVFDQLASYLSADGQTTSSPATEDSTDNKSDTSTQKVEESVSTTIIAEEATTDDITEEEFENLLTELHGDKAPSSVAPSSPKTDNEDITEEEFEQLLDELEGKKATVDNSATKPTPQNVEPEKPAETATATDNTPQSQQPAKKTEKAENQNSKPTETSVRVDTSRLDDIMNMVGELVLVRNRIKTLESSLGEDEEMAKAVNNLTVVTADLQASVMKTRMQPIKKVFGRFPRVVRDIARNLKKEINLELRGEETDLDKNLVEALADPLVHLVRNAVDHGIEMPEVREAADKPRTGQVILSAAQEGDHILLTIMDDGAGMDAELLRQKAVEKGMMDEDYAQRLTESECYALIFSPGFSMKKEISDISGRGVGMDVVKTSIAKLNGVIDIDSEVGRGTTLSIKVPLTLAIMPTLMIMLGRQIFAFPLVNVNEIFHLDLSKTNFVDGQPTINVRNRALPLFYLRDWLAEDKKTEKVRPQYEHVVIVNIGTQRVGFVVDQLIGQEEVVIKPLGILLQGTKGFAGATITGDGRIALILDFPELMNTYAGKGY